MATPSQDRIERRLAAILAANVAGYSRLMGADEAGTARVLREHRAAVDPIVANHGGRIVKTTGDGVLLEFPSIVAAVECAIAMQKLIALLGVPFCRPPVLRPFIVYFFPTLDVPSALSFEPVVGQRGRGEPCRLYDQRAVRAFGAHCHKRTSRRFAEPNQDQRIVPAALPVKKRAANAPRRSRNFRRCGRSNCTTAEEQ